jgi:hypothetical protein
MLGAYEMKISEELHDRILGTCRGGYLGMSWSVTDSDGRPTPGAPLRPGMFIATENYYGYVVMRVNDDLTLTECEKEEL